MKLIRLILATALAALALSAVAGASPAAASYLTLGDYPAAVEGSSNGQIVMNLNGRAVECDGIGFDAETSAPTQQLQTSKASETSNCKSSIGSGQLDLNSCQFVLHPGNPGGSVEIGPAGCGGVTLTAGECTWSVPAQTGIATNYTNQATNPTSVSMQTAGNFTYSVVKGTIATCGKGTLGGSLSTGWTITALNAGGEPISASVTDNLPLGVFLTGNQLAAESYPASLNGVQSAAAKRTFEIAGRTVSCNQANLTGTAASASSSFSLSPSYSGCTAVVLGNLLPATVDASGCSEVYSVTASKAPYTASLNLSCSSPLTINVTSGGTTVCTYTVASQSGLGAVNLTNTGNGAARGVDVGWALTGLAYTRTAGTLATCGGSGGKGIATATGTVQVHGSA